MSLVDLGLASAGQGAASPSRSEASELARFVEAFRGEERHPRWHSDWAWDNYEGIIPALAKRFDLTRICEIGGGRDPLFTADKARSLGLDLTVNDIDQGELDAAPPEFDKARFDIAGDLTRLPVRPGPYDLMVSRMVFEHVADVEKAWNNVHALLAPGGVALCFFPTLYAWPFVLNRIIPDALARSIVRAFFPHRREGAGDPVFPAFYNWCYGREQVLRPMLEKAGFRDIVVQPFWGQHYLAKVPVLRGIDAKLDAILARLDWRLFTSHAYVIVRK